MEKEVEVLSFFEDKKILNYSGENIGELEEFLEANFNYIKDKAVCFTGSRPAHSPWRYNEECELCRDFKNRLKTTLSLLCEYGFSHFISGMALGFDTIASEAVLSFKKNRKNLRLECAIPCKEQANKWSLEQKNRYFEILSQADEVTYVSEDYDQGCFQRRNEYMVKKADLVIAFVNRKGGGSAATANFAIKNGVPIIFIK